MLECQVITVTKIVKTSKKNYFIFLLFKVTHFELQNPNMMYIFVTPKALSESHLSLPQGNPATISDILDDPGK